MSDYGINEYEMMDCVRVSRMEVGKKYLISASDAVSPTQEGGAIYCWGDKRMKVPVECIEEHEHFYTVKVLSHYVHCVNFGKSYPYNVAIMKIDILMQATKIFEVEGELECPDRELVFQASDTDFSLFSPSFS